MGWARIDGPSCCGRVGSYLWLIRAGCRNGRCYTRGGRISTMEFERQPAETTLIWSLDIFASFGLKYRRQFLPRVLCRLWLALMFTFESQAPLRQVPLIDHAFGGDSGCAISFGARCLR
jgi:hypothetical protein